jgi:hypothetical protein
MKYFFLLATVGGIYLFFLHHAPVAPVVQAVTAQEAAPLSSGPRGNTEPAPAAAPPRTDFLKRPIDRTQEVLKQVKARNGDGEF